MGNDPSDELGGAPLVRLSAPAEEGPSIVSALIAPARGMLLVQARAYLPGRGEIDLLAPPPLSEIAGKLGGVDDFNGNVSFSLGGAILLPYANRIRGRPVAARREIETEVLGRTVRLPMNWGGKTPGAEQYAMHGLMLDAAFEVVGQEEAHVRGIFHAGDFGGRWLSATDVTVTWRLAAGGLELSVEAVNAGGEPLPMGIGWHPYFNLPSGDRAQAMLRIAAKARTAVNNYDEVLPTGEILPVAGTPYDFSRGRALGDLYLDDCFTGLQAPGGQASAEVIDPVAGLGLRISATAPPVRAFQVYAPRDRPIVVIEPQFNLADPFGTQWQGAGTGMAVLEPGERTIYAARLELFAP